VPPAGGAARGVLLAVLLSAPVWLGIVWLARRLAAG
jgi:hypothetical protein